MQPAIILVSLDHADFLADEFGRYARDYDLVPRERWSAEDLPPENLATTVPGIFAAGDIRSGSMKRVAAASGEGASIVPLVHAHLEPGG
ncbi:MAG: hypothetical protein WKF79_16220 [Nocardioides sp.]